MTQDAIRPIQDGARRWAAILLCSILRSWAAQLTVSPGAYALAAGPIALLAVGSPRAAPEWFFALSLVFATLGNLLALSYLVGLHVTLRRYRAEAIAFEAAARGMAWAARCGFRASQCIAISMAFGVVAITSFALKGLPVLACLLTPPLAIVLAAVPGAVRAARHADAALAHVVPAGLLPPGGDPRAKFRSGWRFDARMSAVRAAIADRSAPLPSEARDIAKALDGGGMIRPPIAKLHRDPSGSMRLRVHGLQSVLSASIPVALLAWLLAALLPPGTLPALPRPSALWSMATYVEPPADIATDPMSAPSDELEADQASGGNSAGGGRGNGSTTSEGASSSSDAENTSGEEASGAGADGSAGGSGGDREGGLDQDQAAGGGADGASQSSGPEGEGEPGADGGAGSAEGQAEGAGANGPSSGSGSEGGGQAGAGGGPGAGEGQGAGTDGSSDASGQGRGAQPGGGGSGAGDGQGAGGEDSLKGSGQGNGSIRTGNGAKPGNAGGSGADGGQGAGNGGSSQGTGQDSAAQLGDGGGTGSGGPQGEGSGGPSRGEGAGNAARPDGDGGAGLAESREVGEGGDGLAQNDGQAAEGRPAGDGGSGGGENQPAGTGGVPQDPGQGGGWDQGGDGAAGASGTVGAGGASDASARESGEAAEGHDSTSDRAGSDAEGALSRVAPPGQGPDGNRPVLVTGNGEGATEPGVLPSGPTPEGRETLSVATPPLLFAAPGTAPPVVLRDISAEVRPEIPLGPAVPPRQRLPAWIADLAQ